MADMKLISAEVCPFAQRTRLVLLEKGIESELVEIDLHDKPDWFEEVSPLSKVPVLLNGPDRVYESKIINEYIEEVAPEPPLLPADPGARANVRVWVEYDDAVFVPATYKVLLARDDPDRQRVYADRIREALLFMEREALAKRTRGPWWTGDALTLADLSIYPHMERLAVLREYRGIEVPAECGAFREWLAAMAERPSVQQTMHDDAYHVAAYAGYADATADGTTARDMRL